MGDICPTSFIDFAHTLADLARPIALQYFRQNDLYIEQKRAHDPVTFADRTIEKIWRDLIQDTFPEHGIWGEEFGQYQTDAEWVWILDPIDGTKAFTLGRPTFGCLIGLYHKTHGFVAGIVDQPIVQWRWVGVIGKGATFTAPNTGTRILRTKNIALQDIRVALTNPMRFSAPLKQFRQKLNKDIGYMAYGGDCMNYTGLADGSAHALFDSMQKIYDIAAIIPIIREAGGVVTHLDGSPIDFSEDHTIMAAHTPELHSELLQRYQATLSEDITS